jgi:hypothetical protein
MPILGSGLRRRKFSCLMQASLYVVEAGATVGFMAARATPGAGEAAPGLLTLIRTLAQAYRWGRMLEVLGNQLVEVGHEGLLVGGVVHRVVHVRFERPGEDWR